MKIRLLVVIACVFALALSVACGASGALPTEATVPAVSPTVVAPSPTAVSTPAVSTSVSRLCVGGTAQGYPITITLSASDTVVQVTRVQFSVMVVGSGWWAESTRTYAPTAPVEQGYFAFGAVEPGWQVELDGTVDNQSLEGVLWVGHAHPQGLGTAVVETPYSAVCAYHGETG
jgi:hypothetical protein